MNPALGKILGLFTGGSGKLVDSVGGVLDNLITSKEEKEAAKLAIAQEINRHNEEQGRQAIQEAEIYLKDVQSAREANAQIQNSDKASWLSKNVAYMIDLFLTALWGTVTVILFLKIFKIAASDVDMVSLMALHGTVTAVFMTVVNFHRGTSRGSEDKQKHINAMLKEGK